MNNRIKSVTPYCRRCGYTYNPAHPERAVLVFPADDSHVFAACSVCIEELGKVTIQTEKAEMILSFKVVDN